MSSYAALKALSWVVLSTKRQKPVHSSRSSTETRSLPTSSVASKPADVCVVAVTGAEMYLPTATSMPQLLLIRSNPITLLCSKEVSDRKSTRLNSSHVDI